MDSLSKKYRLGEWHMFNREYKKAIRCFQEVIKADPTYNVNQGLTALDQIRKCYNSLKSSDFVNAHEEARTDEDFVSGLKCGFYGLPIMYYQIKSSCIDDHIKHERLAYRKAEKQIEKFLKKHDLEETVEQFFSHAANDIGKLGARWDTFRKVTDRMILKRIIELEPNKLEAYAILAEDYFKSKLYDRTLHYLKRLDDQSPKYYKNNGLSYLELKARNCLEKEAFRDGFSPNFPDNFQKKNVYPESFRKK